MSQRWGTGKCGSGISTIYDNVQHLWETKALKKRFQLYILHATTDIETLESATGNTQEADQEVQEQPPDYAESRRYPVRYRQPPELYM